MQWFSVGQKVVCVADSPIWKGIPGRLVGEPMYWMNYSMRLRQIFERLVELDWELDPNQKGVETLEVLGPYPHKVYEVAAVVYHGGRAGGGLELVGFDGVYHSENFRPLRETDTSIEVFEELLNSCPVLESTSGDDRKALPIETTG